MATIRLLSWNIQKFGPDKALNSDFIEYVCRVIDDCEADLVGFMEVVGGSGLDAMNRCIAVLDNLEAEAAKAAGLAGPRFGWAGWASDKTLSNEQYIFLWKADRIDVADCRLQGMTRWDDVKAIDDALAHPMADLGGDDSLWASLKANGYIDEYGNVPWSKVNALEANPNSLDLTDKWPRFNLDQAQRQQLVNILISDIPQEFSEKRRRPPFIMRAGLGAGGTPAVITLFHAPGPGSVQPVFASNQIGAVPAIRDAAVGVVMGDFNLKPNQLAALTKLRYFNRAKARSEYAKTAQWGFIASRTFQRLTGPAFPQQAADAQSTAVGQYFALLDNVNTSVVKTVQVPAGIITDALVLTTLSSPYDKFLVRSPGATAAAPGANVAQAISLIDAIIPTTRPAPAGGAPVTIRTSATPYKQNLAQLASRVYDEWLDRHARKIRDVAKYTLPVKLSDAHYMYSKSVSDHLPIAMDFQYA